MNPTQHNITALILTYGTRWNFANNCVRKLSEQGIQRIVVVVNGSDTGRDHYSQNAELLFMNRNSGSAEGFSSGLRYIRKTYPDSFVWLFDDDNYPENGCIGKLISSRMTNGDCKEKIFLAYRFDRPLYRRLAQTRNPASLFSKSDRFRSFDIIEYAVSRFFRKEAPVESSAQPVQISVAPYGGLLFHISLVDKIGYPDPDYVFYCDDYDYTRRMTLAGYKIVFLEDVIVRDAEISWNMGGNAVIAMMKSSKVVLYYSLRNTVYFERRYKVRNMARYLCNASIYGIIFILVALLSRKPSYLPVLFRSICDGFLSKRGENHYYRLQ